MYKNSVASDVTSSYKLRF